MSGKRHIALLANTQESKNVKIQENHFESCIGIGRAIITKKI